MSWSIDKKVVDQIFMTKSIELHLCYIMRTDSEHYQSCEGHSLCFKVPSSFGKSSKVTINRLTITLKLMGLSFLPEAFPRWLIGFLMIALLNLIIPLDTCLLKACFWKVGFLFRLNDDEKGPVSSYFQVQVIFRSFDLGGFHFELVKMKHLHFKKVSPLFSLLFLSLMTLLYFMAVFFPWFNLLSLVFYF